MIRSKLARFAIVGVMAAAIPAFAVVSHHHKLTARTAAKTTAVASAKPAVAKKVTTKKVAAHKLAAKKHVAHKLTAKKHVAKKLTTSKKSATALTAKKSVKSM